MESYSYKYRTAALLAFGIAVLMHLFFLIMFLFGRDAVLPPDGAPHRPPRELDFYNLLISFIFNFLFAFALLAINFRVLRSNIKRKTAVGIVLTFAATFLMSFLFAKGQHLIFHGGAADFPIRKVVRGALFRDSLIAIIILLTTEIFRLSNRKQQIALENEALTAENVRTRYEALKNQVDPHFLFNTLNSLNSLIRIDSEKAQEYVHKLSSVFRYTLQGNEVNTLEEELRFASDYCDLMRLRYGDSLSFIFDVDPIYRNFLIVPLSIQTLIENAVKHNVITKRIPLEVTVRTTDDEKIVISNPVKPKKETEESQGIGLANLSERFRLKWQKDIEVTNCNGIFEVKLPLIAPQQKPAK